MLLVVPFLLLTAYAAYAQNTLSGGITLEQGYDSNIDRVSDNEESEWTSTVYPSLEYTRLSRRSNLWVRYRPGIVYSDYTDDVRVDHFASGEYTLQATRNLELSVSDRFVRTENPYHDPDRDRDQELDRQVEDVDLSDRRGRRKYWTNSFFARGAYTYGEERILTLGYANHILENSDDDIYSDYMRHVPFVTLNHRINHQWETRLEHKYTRGEFDEPDRLTESEDLTSNQTDAYVFYRLTPFTRILGHIGYWRTDYDEEIYDYEVYTGATGVEHRYSPTMDLELEVGLSYVERDNFSNEDAFFLRGAMEKRWQRAAWYLEGESGMDARDFSGVDDLGLTRYWEVVTGATKTLMRNVEAGVEVSYRDDTYLDSEFRDDEQRYQASVGLTWAFAQWYEFYCRYRFVSQESDIETDDYDDHSIVAGISAGKDFFRW